MAIEIHLPRKYSRETLEMLRNNDGPNVIMTPGAVETTIEHTTDKLGEPVTKQSVLDIFNKQVIERVNSLPKYSRDYYFVPTGNFGGWHDNGLHAGLVNMLGNAYLSNEYGFMCMHDYLKLSDFRDREGDITIDDLSNTFSETINKLGTLSRLKILIKKGNLTLTQNTYYAISNGSTPPNLIDYNEVKNRIISSDEFNSVCKKWYRRIIDNSNDNIMVYEYRLPDPPAPADGGVKFLRKEAYFESVDLGDHGRIGKNSIHYGAIFGEGDTTSFFEIPRVTRNLKGVGIHISTDGQLDNSGRFGLKVYNKDNNVILGYIPWTHGTGNRMFYFNNPISLTDRSYDDLILMLNTKVSGDRGDAMGMTATINELLFDDNVRISPVPILPNASNINNELSGPEFDINGNFLKVTYKYILKDCHAKLGEIHSVFINSHLNSHHFIERIEQWRNGVLIGTSLNPTYTNGITDRNQVRWNSRYNGNRHNTLITMKHDISNLDFKNGDELRFVYGYIYHLPNWIGTNRGSSTDDLTVFRNLKLEQKVTLVLCKDELISR